MIKKIGAAVATAALAAGGMVAIGAGTAHAAANSDIDCSSVKAKVTITPALTMTPTVVSTSISGKLKECTATNLPAGATLKGGGVTGSVEQTNNPATCDIGELAGTSEADVNLVIVWKVKKGVLANTNINFTNRDGFTLPGSGGVSNVSGTSSALDVEIVGNATGDVPKIIKKCYGKDGVPAPPHGKGVSKIKVASGTYTTS